MHPPSLEANSKYGICDRCFEIGIHKLIYAEPNLGIDHNIADKASPNCKICGTKIKLQGETNRICNACFATIILTTLNCLRGSAAEKSGRALKHKKTPVTSQKFNDKQCFFCETSFMTNERKFPVGTNKNCFICDVCLYLGIEAIIYGTLSYLPEVKDLVENELRGKNAISVARAKLIREIYFSWISRMIAFL